MRQPAAPDTDAVTDVIEVGLQILHAADVVHQDFAVRPADPVKGIAQPEMVGRGTATATKNLPSQGALVLDQQPLDEADKIRLTIHGPRKQIPLAAFVVMIERDHLVPWISHDGELEIFERITPFALAKSKIVHDGIMPAGAASQNAVRQRATDALPRAFVDVYKNELVAMVDHVV